MSEVLYRKYRPKNFNELVGQDQVKEILSKAVEKNSLSHAYIFSGSRGTGKTTSARILAKMLNCQTEDSLKPCGLCQSCKAIDTSSHMDVIELDAASYRGIDEIRKIRDAASYRPVMGGYKVYIIDEFHMLTREAFNALLKTLEEPPERVVFILATTNLEKVPETVLSRCQIFNFKPLTQEEIILYLKSVADREGLSYKENALNRISRAARGGMRDAVNLMERVLAFTGSLDDQSVRNTLGVLPEETVEKFIEVFLQGDPDRLLQISKSLTREGFSYETLLEQAIDNLKERLVLTGSREDLELISAFWTVLKELKYAQDKRSVFEVMTILHSMKRESEKVREKIQTKENLAQTPKEGYAESATSAETAEIAKGDPGEIETLMEQLYQKDFTLLWVLLGLSQIKRSSEKDTLFIEAESPFADSLLEANIESLNELARIVIKKEFKLDRPKNESVLDNFEGSEKEYVKKCMDVFGLGEMEFDTLKFEIEED